MSLQKYFPCDIVILLCDELSRIFTCCRHSFSGVGKIVDSCINVGGNWSCIGRSVGTGLRE